MQPLLTEAKNENESKSGFFFNQWSPSTLLLQNGMQFKGVSPSWQKESALGELVFNTGMTGYDASLTDPSYSNEILLFTYPLIGNYGIPREDEWESEKIHASGVVVCNPCSDWSHGKSVHSLAEWLYLQQVPMIAGVDTRLITTILRESGTMTGMILPDQCSVPALPLPTPRFTPVSINKKIIYTPNQQSPAKTKKIALVDCGMKANILRHLLKFPLHIERVPHDYDYTKEPFDGIFLSNGPGNPENYAETIKILKKAMKKEMPIFGICLGAQLMALAAGAKTYKLRYGHRSHNQPCIELESKRCFITSQNHGYAIQEETLQESLPKGWQVSFRNLNDGSVEGIRHQTLPFAAVQFHPEAAPGPTDTQWLFEQFFAML